MRAQALQADADAKHDEEVRLNTHSTGCGDECIGKLYDFLYPLRVSMQEAVSCDADNEESQEQGQARTRHFQAWYWSALF